MTMIKIHSSTSKIGAALAAGALVFGTVSCGAAAAEKPAAMATKDVSGMNVYLVGAGDVNPWTKIYNAVVIEGMEAKGAKVTYLQDPFDPQVQVQNLDRAVAAKPDLIMLLGLDYRALTPGLTRAQTAGIPVINMTSPPKPADDLFALSVESDQVSLGKFAAQNIIEGLKKQGVSKGNVIAITGTAGTEQVSVRLEAFKKELATVEGLDLVAVEDGNWDQATSQRLAQQLLAKYASKGGIQAAYGMADNQALGIIQGAKQAGTTVGGDKGLVVSGSNCYMSGLESIKAGELFGTASESPEEEAKYTVEMTLKYLAGEDLPKKLFAPESRITAANVQAALDGKICP
ncbi:sugar ABC transporter substrate-binding protein [Paenarthrobacter nitroguajacolicus]|jgi:ribose transport system substrate-binding protein|uniref:sugar ABC transporter substrate-binding protein n=2 Tax=Paenarthrobacter TaxID=1742992 RepID=UPI003AD90D4B